MVTANVDVPDGFRAGFLTGARQSLRRRGMASQLVNVVSQGGSVRLLRVHDVGDEKRALFRMLSQEVGVNYHDMVLVKRSGRVQAVDVYVFATAEKISDTTRRLYLMAAAGSSQTLVGKLVGGEGEFVKHAEDFKRMSENAQAGRFQKVLDGYHGLPKSMREEKAVMMMRVMAAQRISEDEYAQAIAEFRKNHPNDACLDMLSIDGYLLRKKHELALECVDRLDKAVGGDPYLNSLRSGINADRENWAEARRFAQKAVEGAPDLPEGYWQMVAVTLGEKKHAETAKWLTTIEEKFNLQMNNLESTPEYGEFIKSPEYRSWKESRGNRE
jgi:hypothetical protein